MDWTQGLNFAPRCLSSREAKCSLARVVTSSSQSDELIIATSLVLSVSAGVLGDVWLCYLLPPFPSYPFLTPVLSPAIPSSLPSASGGCEGPPHTHSRFYLGTLVAPGHQGDLSLSVRVFTVRSPHRGLTNLFHACCLSSDSLLLEYR